MTTPFTSGTDAFYNISENCELLVPEGKVYIYKFVGWTDKVFKGGVYDGTEDTFTYTYEGKTLKYQITDEESGYVAVGDGSPAISTSESGVVTIPSNVECNGRYFIVSEINSAAFEGCSGLTKVELPYTMGNIESEAFRGCTGLTEMTLPRYMFGIKESAFSGCSSLAKVTSEVDSPFTFGMDAFKGINENCKLYVPAGTKDAYIAKGWTTDVFKGGIYDGTEADGDLNGDGQMNISDVTALVNMVLGKTAKTAAADVNGDGEVNISDVTALVNMILGKN